ncbi:MAG: carboxypeptidase-like regulatory domain-containing protein [Gemmatimonadota bacterium]
MWSYHFGPLRARRLFAPVRAGTLALFVSAIVLSFGASACRDGEAGFLLSFGEGGSVEGEVLDAQGAGIAGVRVTLSDGAGDVRSTATDTSGTYRFGTVETGSWTLTVETPSGFVPASGESLQRQFEVGPDAVVRQNFRLTRL